MKQWYLFYTEGFTKLHQLGGELANTKLHQSGGEIGNVILQQTIAEKTHQLVKRCNYFDILQKNTYKTSINSTFATKTVKNLHMCNFCSTFAAQRSRLNDHGVSRLFEAAKPK